MELTWPARARTPVHYIFSQGCCFVSRLCGHLAVSWTLR